MDKILSILIFAFAIAIVFYGIRHSLRIAKKKKEKEELAKKIYEIKAIKYSPNDSADYIFKKINLMRHHCNTNQVKDLFDQKISEHKLDFAKPLQADSHTTALAYRRNQGMIKFENLTHASSGEAFQDLIKLGADEVGEILAYGYSTSEKVMRAWMNSPKHRETILNSRWDWCGINVMQDNKGMRWFCVIFGQEEIEDTFGSGVS